ncbi:MAG: class I SAM-dependent methyltransferase [Planctomycetota bacterium]|nr:MAG: class I SAM-dependent methyltransferase [Planctomycetota bacterium]
MPPRRPRLPGPDLRAARTQAYALAMAPFCFQAARAARQLGLLEQLRQAGAQGTTAAALSEGLQLPATSTEALLDALLCVELVAELEDGAWCLTTVGLTWLSDPALAVEVAFTHEVCWQGLFDMSESLAAAKPIGLRHLGPWPTIYEGLTQLSPAARKAWFDYDHGHSDSAFAAALDHVAASAPQQLLDVGANTGRFALRALARLNQTRLTLLDLPAQLAEAKAALSTAGLVERAQLQALDLLDHSIPFPSGQDAVWMSQFLDCFAPSDIQALLARAAACLNPGGSVWVLECCPDRQSEEAARICLRAASLYFIALANGVSRFYRSQTLIDCAAAAGLRLATSHDGLGSAHTLFRFVKA